MGFNLRLAEDFGMPKEKPRKPFNVWVEIVIPASVGVALAIAGVLGYTHYLAPRIG